ncbi:RHS repeat-associated core domain-containing protein [Parasulfitobacter algicola]|uniref:RHS repeat-associated core domain-containing protein n=1 Tax=Parasulfitobacter algicola TaxID=2614809 RepID=UPI001C2D77D8
MDEPLAYEDYTSTTAPGSGSVFELFRNRLGSILTAVVLSTGTVAADYEYDSFGQRELAAGSVEQRYGFTGREHDAETGLIYYRARHYDPALGQFLQRDPIGFAAGDLNLYADVWNDPYNWTDPSGLYSATLDWRKVTAGVVVLGFGACLGTEHCIDNIMNLPSGNNSLDGAIVTINQSTMTLMAKILAAILNATNDDESDESWRETGDPPPSGHNRPPKDPEDPKYPPIPWWPGHDDPMNDPDNWIETSETADDYLPGSSGGDRVLPDSPIGKGIVILARLLQIFGG